ncbi:MAG TPA: carbonic anhydrase [Vicinamibacterales bacterium]
MTLTASDALARLREGNRRFVAGVRSLEALLTQTRRADLATSQRPFAIVLGCSDSRVPAELVFDQGLGDLFVIRVAGNIVAPSQIGSVEFAAERFGIRLVVVLGHTCCSAVTTTLEQLRGGDHPSPNLRAIVDRIQPTVETLLAAGLDLDDEGIVRQAVRANVRQAADQLRHGSVLLESLRREGLRVVGAEYSLSTGEVDFFDGENLDEG